MSKANGAASKSAQPMSETERLNAVRELIFGENMAEYSKEFSILRDQIGKHHTQVKQMLVDESTALTEKLDALEYSFNQSLKQLKKELDQNAEHIESLQSETTASRRELGAALSSIAESLQK